MTNTPVRRSRHEHVRNIALSPPRERIVILHVSLDVDNDMISSGIYPVIAICARTIDVWHHPSSGLCPIAPTTEGLIQEGWVWSYSETDAQFLVLFTEDGLSFSLMTKDDLEWDHTAQLAVICSWTEDEDEKRLALDLDRLANYLRRVRDERELNSTGNP